LATNLKEDLWHVEGMMVLCHGVFLWGRMTEVGESDGRLDE
jgi:hypothetical protein